VLEMVWQPSGLTTTEEMVLLVEPEGSGLGGGEAHGATESDEWGRVQGPSILKYVITDNETLEQVQEAAEEGEPYQTRVFPPADVGNLVYQQRFEIFATHFYYSLPADGYSAIPEGYSP
jgi:hypothetical protein